MDLIQIPPPGDNIIKLFFSSSLIKRLGGQGQGPGAKGQGPGAKLMKRLTTENIRLGLKCLPGTNDLSYNGDL